VRWRRNASATLDDVIEYLRGIGTILMAIDAKIVRLVQENGDEDEEEERS
jgi:uncharacterized protein YjeT (DUF2065 family)